MNPLAERIAEFIRSKGGRATSADIAGAVLRIPDGSRARLGQTLVRLMGPDVSRFERDRDLWSLVPESPQSPAAPSQNPLLREHVLLAAMDLSRGSLLPARMAIAPISVPEQFPCNLIDWPGDDVKRAVDLASSHPVIVTGPSEHRIAFLVWRDGIGTTSTAPSSLGDALRAGPPVLLLAPLLAAMRLPALRGSHSTRARSSERDPDPDDYDSMTPRARALRALAPARELVRSLAMIGMESWRNVACSPLAFGIDPDGGRPDFDFPDRSFDRAFLDALPEGPGIYRFFDRAGKLIYVGQSRTLRRRVASYFRPGTLTAASSGIDEIAASDTGNDAEQAETRRIRKTSRRDEITRRAYRISFVELATDLAAQVREASEIRRRRPEINTQRVVRERAAGIPWLGPRVVVIPSKSGRVREVILLDAAEVVDRRRFTRRGGEKHPDAATVLRLEKLLARYFPEEAARVKSRISRTAADEASQLLASWVRKRGDRVMSFDPTDSPGSADAARRLAGMLAADLSEGSVSIR